MSMYEKPSEINFKKTRKQHTVGTVPNLMDK
jgi:hypothetical protein